jgi:beta-lactamase regulating signal transducer with metallopeptidase domain
MNDLGLSLLWLAVQVAVMMAPAMVLHTLASRRGPSSGAWVASLSLVLVVALSAALLLKRTELPNNWLATGNWPSTKAPNASVTVDATPKSSTREIGSGSSRPTTGRSPFLAGIGIVWARIEHGAAAPAARWRPWGRIVAAIALTGATVGLARLLLGLWAIGLCRRRGRIVDDPLMTALLAELRSSMGCRQSVEIRQVPDLTAPATAGWRRPVLLFPDDWRSWDACERRAVLAHELAHIVRGDYGAGLLAQLAVVLHYFHPLVRWMAGQLQLQQELAADALCAPFAGGRASYLVALSRLALKQDGRSPCWPARAFLPARGALIRRIAMLRDENKAYELDRSWSGARRLTIAVILVVLAVSVATVRGPARGDDKEMSAASAGNDRTPATRPAEAPVVPLYVRDDVAGVAMFRPAATFRRAGMDRFAALIRAELGDDLAQLAKRFNIDMSGSARLKLDFCDIEWVTCGIRFGRTKNTEKKVMHRIMTTGPTVRTIKPFDWLGYLRQWHIDFVEVRSGGRVYYRVTGPLAKALGPDGCVYLPDDRTLVLDEEKPIRALIDRRGPEAPAYLRGPDWERASRGLFAIAINNHEGSFAKSYDLGRPDDAVVLTLFKDVDYWTVNVDDADAIILHAAAACQTDDVREAIARTIDALVKQGRDAIDHPATDAAAMKEDELFLPMASACLANLRVERANRTVNVRAQGFGTLADFASIFEAEINRRAQSQKRIAKDDPNGLKR